MGNWHIDDDGTVVISLKNGFNDPIENNGITDKQGQGLYVYGKPDEFEVMFGNESLGSCLYDSTNAYPFIIAGGKVYVGGASEGHWDIGRQLIKFAGSRNSYEYEVKRDKAVGELQRYPDYSAGRIWINPDINYSIFDNGCIISFWDSLDTKRIVKGKMLIKLLSHFGMGADNTYIAIVDNQDDSVGKLVKYNGGDVQLSTMSDKQREYYAIHLMNQKDKREALSDFVRNRAETLYVPREKVFGSMAAYHNAVHTENISKIVKSVLKEYIYKDKKIIIF